MKKIKFSLSSLAFLFIGHLAYGAQITPEQYPTRYIDRPYTLPMGVHEFDVGVVGSFPLNADAYTYFTINPVYRQALSDNYTLLWDPLPLGIQYQPLHTANETLGASWSLGFPIIDGAINLKPTFTSFYLNKPSINFAWDTRILYFWDFPLNDNFSTWSGEISSGPVWQLNDYTALGPRLGFDIRNFVLRKITEQGGNYPTPDFTYFLGVTGRVAGGKMWELSSDVKLDGFNFVGVNTSYLTVGLNLAEYW